MEAEGGASSSPGFRGTSQPDPRACCESARSPGEWRAAGGESGEGRRGPDLSRGQLVEGRHRTTCWGRLPSQPQYLVVPQELCKRRGQELSTGPEPRAWWIDQAPDRRENHRFGLDELRSGVGGKAGSRVGLGFAVCRSGLISHVVNPQGIPRVTVESTRSGSGRSLRSAGPSPTSRAEHRLADALQPDAQSRGWLPTTSIHFDVTSSSGSAPWKPSKA
jgi:hypothetical protein